MLHCIRIAGEAGAEEDAVLAAGSVRGVRRIASAVLLLRLCCGLPVVEDGSMRAGEPAFEHFAFESIGLVPCIAAAPLHGAAGTFAAPAFGFRSSFLFLLIRLNHAFAPKDLNVLTTFRVYFFLIPILGG